MTNVVRAVPRRNESLWRTRADPNVTENVAVRACVTWKETLKRLPGSGFAGEAPGLPITGLAPAPAAAAGMSTEADTTSAESSSHRQDILRQSVVGDAAKFKGPPHMV